MNIFKGLLAFTYLSWMIVSVLALLNPTVKSLVPLIICSTSLIVAVVVTKND